MNSTGGDVHRVLIIGLTALTLSACATEGPEDSLSPNLRTSSGRQAELSKESFDTCTFRTPEETWVHWDAVLSEDDKRTLKNTPYGDLIIFHHGWGTGIRNEFCLWRGGSLQNWFRDHGVEHPDSMSQILIELYWAHLMNCDSDVEQFSSSDYPTDSKFLGCPAGIDQSVPDNLHEAEANSDD